MNIENKTQQVLFLILGIALLTTISASTSVIFAEDEDDEIEKGEVGEEGETITKLIATGHDKKLTTMVTVPKPPTVNNILENILNPVPEVSAQKPVQKQQPVKDKDNNGTKQQTTDKGMKLVLGDIVLPINPQSDFQLELPFSKITVQPVK